MFFFVQSNFVFAADLEIDIGKNEKFSFRGDNENKSSWYDDTVVYDNINIGAGTRVVLDSQWEYFFKGDSINTSQPDPEKGNYPQNKIVTTEYEYAKEENLATLSLKNDGKLILNSGSELSLRNEYNLITSANNVALQYEQYGDSDNIYIFFRRFRLCL